MNYPTASATASPVSRAMPSQKSTPSAALYTPTSPSPGPQAVSPNQFISNRSNSAQQQAVLSSTMDNKVAQQQWMPMSNNVHPPQQVAVNFHQPMYTPQPRYHRYVAQAKPKLEILLGPQADMNTPSPPEIKSMTHKSRVETQIKLMMVLKNPPPGITSVHMPTHTISKPKLQSRPPPPLSPDKLEMSVALFCTSAMIQPALKKKAFDTCARNPQRPKKEDIPLNKEGENAPQNGAEVRICAGCISREQKRAARKKSKQVDAEAAWEADQEFRVIVFNTSEVRVWKPDPRDNNNTGRTGAIYVDCPVRIACYCRHQGGEKLGFNVIFTLKDYTGRLIAQEMSDPIMITDDHKTSSVTPITQQSSPEKADQPTPTTETQDVQSHLAPTRAFTAARSPQASHSPPSLQGRTLSRPASPSSGGPSKKKKKFNSPRVPNDLAMTRMEPSLPPSEGMGSFQPHPFMQQDSIFLQANGMGPFATNPPTPNTNDQASFNFTNHRSSSLDNMSMPQLYSAPPSNHPSRAPSPSGIQNSILNQAQAQAQAQPTQAITNNFISTPLDTNQRSPPMIHKVIPGEGSKMGGSEVTILGAGFHRGLEIYFGTVKAVTTTYWGESSLVCLLPPAASAGIVQVRCQGTQGQFLSNTPVFFRYLDDSELHLMRLALQCVGGRTLGTDCDVSALARHVIDSYGAGQGGGSGEQSGPSGQGGQMYNQASNSGLEPQLLKCLDVIDLDDSPRRADLDKKNLAGHTMLHLATSLGFHRFTAALIARGADPNALDNGHFTPLHIAAIHNQPEIARRLISAGAEPRLRSSSGMTPLDIAESGAVMRTIRSTASSSGLHTRSRSETSIRSRASSVSSLRSLVPLTRASIFKDPPRIDPGEESPEYTDGDFEDEDLYADEGPDESYVTMRRFHRGQTEIDDELASSLNLFPNPMIAVWKDQVQQQFAQFQQHLMTLNFQNFTHLPQIPQIPAFAGIPVLRDYEAYLQQARQYMPGMAGGRPEESRPDSPDGLGAKMAQGWWGLGSSASVTAAAAAPPPPYEEKPPRLATDKKQASVAQAVAEAVADTKCASLFDEPSTSTKEEENVPTVIQIGRKHSKEEQEQFRRARETNLKRLSKDKNLFFIWVSSSSHSTTPA